MTVFDKIYQLTSKLSKAILEDKGFHALEESDFLSDDSKKYIKQQLSDEAIKDNLELLNKIDKKAGWEQIKDGISPHVEVKTKKRPLTSFYKVAAVVVLLLSLTYITFHYPNTTKLIAVEQVNVPAGSDKAILTLEDGNDIILEKGSQYQNGNIKSNGEQLAYSKTNDNSKTAYNYLTIPRGGQYQLLLSDSTSVWLNAETKIKYPVNFVEGKPRNVELVYGEAYFKVSPSTKHQGATFKVITKMQEVEVVGTEFNIKAYNDEEQIYTTLVEGLVNVVVDEKEQKLRPGEQSTLEIDTKDITTHRINIDYDIAWVRGYFNFKDKPLKEIMKVLSRWYDVDISFETSDIENVKFSGLLNRKQNIQDILNGIKNTRFINAYEIKNNNITIK